MYWANYDKAHSLQKVYLQSDELSRNSRLDMAVPMPNHCPTLASNSSQKLATSRRSSSLSACSHSCGSSRTASRRRPRSQDRSRHVDPHAWIVGRHHVLLLDAWEPDFRTQSLWSKHSRPFQNGGKSTAWYQWYAAAVGM